MNKGENLMEIACNCDGLPAHDHFMGHELNKNSVFGPVWDLESIGRIWVDWKAFARALAREFGDQ